jgi:hypothetical protein
VQKLPCGALANVRPGSWTFGPLARSTAEGAVEERGKEVFSLPQRLPLHRTEGLDPLHHLLKFPLAPPRRQWNYPSLQCVRVSHRVRNTLYENSLRLPDAMESDRKLMILLPAAGCPPSTTASRPEPEPTFFVHQFLPIFSQ